MEGVGTRSLISDWLTSSVVSVLRGKGQMKKVNMPLIPNSTDSKQYKTKT